MRDPWPDPSTPLRSARDDKQGAGHSARDDKQGAAALVVPTEARVPFCHSDWSPGSVCHSDRSLGRLPRRSGGIWHRTGYRLRLARHDKRGCSTRLGVTRRGRRVTQRTRICHSDRSLGDSPRRSGGIWHRTGYRLRLARDDKRGCSTRLGVTRRGRCVTQRTPVCHSDRSLGDSPRRSGGIWLRMDCVLCMSGHAIVVDNTVVLCYDMGGSNKGSVRRFR